MLGCAIMAEHTRRRRELIAILVLSLIAGACSSPGARESPPTTKAARSGTPVPSAGCSLPASVSVTELRQNITVNGVKRWYLLTTPSTRQGSPLPVVVDLHGLSESATLEAITTQFSPTALANRFIVVFPQGTGNPAGWDIDPGTSAHPNRDIDFMDAILDNLEKQLCVDKSRIYATGLSDGALFTSLLACAMANRFAAFAPVAGVVMPVPCHPGRPGAHRGLPWHRRPDPALSTAACPGQRHRPSISTARVTRQTSKPGR